MDPTHDALDTPLPPPPTANPVAVPALASMEPIAPAAATQTPLDALRADMQPIMRDLLIDRPYLEMIKRTASPRTFLEFVRFAFAADEQAKAGGGNNQQVIIQAPFPRGPLDVLPSHMRIE